MEYLCEDNYLGETDANQIINRTGLRTRMRSKMVKPKLEKIMPNGIFHFSCPSKSTPGKVWQIAIFPLELVDASRDMKANKIAEEDLDGIVDSILEGKLKVWCGCPMFHMWGGDYLNSQANSKLGQPERRPLIKNTDPKLVGFGCKHLLAALPEFKNLRNVLRKKLEENFFNPQQVYSRSKDITDPKIIDSGF